MPQALTEAREPVNILYYGDGGTGKTTNLATMANQGKVLMINAEAGIKSRPLRERGIKVENIELFPGPDEEITFRSLEAEWLRVREALAKDPDAYVGVVWDSVTEIYKALLDRVVGKAVEKAKRNGKDRDRFFIALEDYGVMTEQMRSLVRRYRDLPCHWGVAALAKRFQDDDGKATYLPAISPALVTELVGYVDLVCVTSVALVGEHEEFRGLFRPHGKYRGKDRLGALPKWLVDPTFDRVLGYAEGKLTLEQDAVMKAARKRAEQDKSSDGAPTPGAEQEREEIVHA